MFTLGSLDSTSSSSSVAPYQPPPPPPPAPPQRQALFGKDTFTPASATAKAPSGLKGSRTREIAMQLNHKYEPNKAKHETYCNFFTQDVLKHRGVSGKAFPAQNANNTNQWLNSAAGRKQGWQQVSGAEAQAWVNKGGVGVVSRYNPNGHGHIAPIIEGTAKNGVPMISNAGSKNFLEGPATQSPVFRKSGTQYFIYNP